MTGVFVTNKKNKNNIKLVTLPKIKNFKFSVLFSLKKLTIIKTNKIIRIYAVGVCIDKKAKTHIKGSRNHNTLLFFLIATKRLKTASNENI